MNQNLQDLRLNPEQSEAASNIEGPMMVLAGPGTGKTQVLAARIASILSETHMYPHNILCLTFTDSGVVAMRKRLLNVIGQAAYQVRIHTFHSFCNEVIKDNPDVFSRTRELESIDELTMIQLFNKLIDELEPNNELKPFSNHYQHRANIIDLIKILKKEEVSPIDFTKILDEIEAELNEFGSEIESFVAIHGLKLKEEDLERMRGRLCSTSFEPLFLNAPYPLEKKERTRLKSDLKKFYSDMKKQLPMQRTLAGIYSRYQEELSKQGLYDFEDMILFVIRAFKEEKDLLALYQEQYQYILVDEYQDTNGAQNEVIQLLSNYFDRPNLFVVGDDKQSIFRFQGASLENILYFYRRYEGLIKRISLKENYRSQQMILDGAYSLIKNAKHSIDQFIPDMDFKPLKAARDIKSSPIELYEFDQIGTEHYFLAKKVQTLLESGINPSEIAIFFRNNREAEPLVDLFLRLGVPFRLEKGGNILDDIYIRQLIDLLRLIFNNEDAHLMFRVINFEFLGFKSLDIHKFTSQISRSADFFDSMLNSNIFQNFAERILKWRKLSYNKPALELLDNVLRESNYLNFIMKSEDKVEHLNRLNSFFDILRERSKKDTQITIECFLKDIQLFQDNNLTIREHELQTKKNAVRLMTAHRSKGLEFEHVFIMNCVDKHWGNAIRRKRIKLPAKLLKEDVFAAIQENNEDDRRLFYVAMTRAKHKLYLTYSRKNESGSDRMPSMFVSEIDKKFIKLIDTSNVENEALKRLQTAFLERPKHDVSNEEREFVMSLLENYKMSVTHLNNYLSCPLLFYYQNLIRVPRSMNKWSAYGSAVHATLHQFTIRYKQEGRLPSKEMLISEFQGQIKRHILSEQDLLAALHMGESMFNDYYEAFQYDFSLDVLSEFDFGSHGVNLNGIPLTGKIDQMKINGDNVHVIDFKTGNPDSKRNELKPDGAYYRQIVFYNLLCKLSPKFPYKMQSGEIRFLGKSKKTGKFKQEIINVTAEDLDRLKTQIEDVYKDIQNLAFLSKDEWMRCGECEYCKMDFGGR